MSGTESVHTREADRFEAALVVNVKSSWGKSQPHYEVSKDISENGVFIQSGKLQELGADLRLEFALPANGAYLTRYGEIFYGWAEGRVIRVDYDGYAVQLEEDYRLAIPRDAFSNTSH